MQIKLLTHAINYFEIFQAIRYSFIHFNSYTIVNCHVAKIAKQLDREIVELKKSLFTIHITKIPKVKATSACQFI